MMRYLTGYELVTNGVFLDPRTSLGAALKLVNVPCE